MKFGRFQNFFPLCLPYELNGTNSLVVLCGVLFSDLFCFVLLFFSEEPAASENGMKWNENVPWHTAFVSARNFHANCLH